MTVETAMVPASHTPIAGHSAGRPISRPATIPAANDSATGPSFTATVMSRAATGRRRRCERATDHRQICR